MSYSINGIRVNNFKLENIECELKKIKEIATFEGDKRSIKLLNIFLIYYLNYKQSNDTSNLKEFFYLFTEKQDILNFKTNASNIIEGLSDFFNNHLFDENVYFYFLPNKNYCLISFKKEMFIHSLVKSFDNYDDYSIWTSSGCTSYMEEQLTDEDEKYKIYEMVENDWDLCTKDSFYIHENAFSQVVYSYSSFFSKNIDKFINDTTLKDALTSIPDELVYYHYKEFFIENLQKEITDSKTFLRKRREILDSDDIKNIVLNDFKDKVNNIDDKSYLKELFNLSFDFK